MGFRQDLEELDVVRLGGACKETCGRCGLMSILNVCLHAFQFVQFEVLGFRGASAEGLHGGN